MKSVYCLNPISNAGMSRFDDTYCIADSIENADAVLLRSASMHEITLPDSLLAIGRAGAGVNNIPLDSCAKKGIVVFNTPGANANGVKELVIAGLMLASRVTGYVKIRMTQILQRQLRRQRRLLLEMKLRERSLA